MLSPPAPSVPGEGVLAVEWAGAGRGSVITRLAARSPLQLLAPRNHGHAVWAFLSSHGGGLVDGDATTLDVHVGAGATALLTTQASTKVYRSPRGCRQRLTADVGAGGLLVVLPDPLVCFTGARLEQEVCVRLAPDASVVLVDALTCGRAARGERWAFARYRSALEVRRAAAPDTAPIMRDVVELDAAHGPLAARLGGWDALATVIAIGPRAPLAPVAAAARGDRWLTATSPLAEGTLVRAAAATVDELHRGLRALLVAIPDLLGDDPFARKW